MFILKARHQDEVIVTYQGYPLGLAKSRLTAEKQLSARAGSRWSLFTGNDRTA
jgi:NOL1/NOP2/fmu family ribosome biogenesis protein